MKIEWRKNVTEHTDRRSLKPYATCTKRHSQIKFKFIANKVSFYIFMTQTPWLGGVWLGWVGIAMIWNENEIFFMFKKTLQFYYHSTWEDENKNHESCWLILCHLQWNVDESGERVKSRAKFLHKLSSKQHKKSTFFFMFQRLKIGWLIAWSYS